MSLAMSSAMLSQLYLFSTPSIDPHPLDFRDVGKPLACSCLGAAIIINVIGAARFHRAQEAILRGKVIIGGADLMIVGALIGAVSRQIFNIDPRALTQRLTAVTACDSAHGHRLNCVERSFCREYLA